MKERPILFSGPMVRAILGGRKTMTRRVVKHTESMSANMMEGEESAWCPYGQPGDRLWVREAFNVQPDIWAATHGPQPIHYSADTRKCEIEDYTGKPSIHMPRWASRITLEVTAVRVERVQEITYRDCEAEGLFHGARGMWSCPGTDEIFAEGYKGYRWLWDKLNEKRGFGWDVNPWVWVIEFRRVT